MICYRHKQQNKMSSVRLKMFQNKMFTTARCMNICVLEPWLSDLFDLMFGLWLFSDSTVQHQDVATKRSIWYILIMTFVKCCTRLLFYYRINPILCRRWGWCRGGRVGGQHFEIINCEQDNKIEIKKPKSTLEMVQSLFVFSLNLGMTQRPSAKNHTVQFIGD